MSVNVPWAEKYRPRRLVEIVGNKKAISTLMTWLKSWEKGIPNKRAVLLYGPPGVGKTTLVHVIANELGYELIELNASDIRRAEELERVIARALNTSSLFGTKGRIIFFDEIDGMSGTEDQGGLAKIVDIIERTRIPVIMAANDPWDPKFRTLRNLSLVIRLNRLRVHEVMRILGRICMSEGIKADPAALKAIATMAEGDLRSAINDLQAVAQGRKFLTLEDVQGLGRRIREYDVFTVLKMLFSARTAEEAKAVLSRSAIGYDMLIQWIHENLPYQYKDPEELWKAYDALSRADVYFGRIRRTQNWSLLSYALDLVTAGVAMARKHPYHFVKYQFPKRLLMLSRAKSARQLREAICKRIARQIHVSKRYANAEIIPLLKVIFEANPMMGAKIAKALDLNKDMIDLITGDERCTKAILKNMRQIEEEKEEGERKPFSPLFT